MNKVQLEKLFTKAVSNLVGVATIKSKIGKGKAFELFALVLVLRRMRRAGYSVHSVPPIGMPANELIFAGGPCSADKTKFTHFELHRNGEVREAWISVEVQTLSSALSGTTTKASYHELDIGIFDALTSSKPSFLEVCFGASCKDRGFAKEQLREVLGLRRETALLNEHGTTSEADWFISPVPADPPSPMVLFSRDGAATHYDATVRSLGTYVRHLKFP